MSSRGWKHTPEWRAAASARLLKWTPEMDAVVCAWYEAHAGGKLELAELALQLGIGKHSVCRRARTLGLTEHRRKTGRKPSAKYATEAESRRAIGRATKERIAKNGHPRGAKGLVHTPETWARIRAGAAKWHATASAGERRAQIDKGQATKLERYGRLSPKLTGSNIYSRCKHGRREDLGGQFFRSSWEANYARFLNLLISQGQIAKWEFEADTFWFEKIKRGVRSYTPDFRITEPSGAVYYVEVKGWMDAKSQTKIKRMAKYHPHIELRVVGAKAYYEIEKKLSGAIPDWERAA